MSNKSRSRSSSPKPKMSEPKASEKSVVPEILPCSVMNRQSLIEAIKQNPEILMIFINRASVGAADAYGITQKALKVAPKHSNDNEMDYTEVYENIFFIYEKYYGSGSESESTLDRILNELEKFAK